MKYAKSLISYTNLNHNNVYIMVWKCLNCHNSIAICLFFSFLVVDRTHNTYIKDKKNDIKNILKRS